MHTKTTSIQVIDRLSQILDVIASYDEPVSLKILSAETGLHPSTAFRILASLGEHGYVERDEAGYYRLGIRLLQLGGRVRVSVDLRHTARPIMEELRDQIGETVNLTVREGDEVVYVERATSSRMMRVEQVVGSRAPLHVTAVGKLMLGDTGEEECLRYANRTKLPAYTRNTITDPKKLIKECSSVLASGYALDNEEAEAGVGCIGTLVHDANGLVVAGLSISAPIERRKEDWIPLVIEAGKRISERLGHFEK